MRDAIGAWIGVIIRTHYASTGAAGGERLFQAEKIMRTKPLGRKGLICFKSRKANGDRI